MDAGSLGSCSSGGGTPSPPTLTFGSPATAHSPSARGGSSPKSGLGSLTPTRSTPESPLGAALPPPPPPPKQPGFGVLHALNGRALYGGMRPPPSPPGIPSDASATDCRLIDYRGAKIAAFLVNGEYLLCLPQAFELFLKHLVGGLHTVYTKLKRLDITPIVCNVEQVRILRGLGAIQPGVNRCKLLSCKDFDSLYKDCTTARSAKQCPPYLSLQLLAPCMRVPVRVVRVCARRGDHVAVRSREGKGVLRVTRIVRVKSLDCFCVSISGIERLRTAYLTVIRPVAISLCHIRSLQR
ncbi:hypothetical protein HPB48_018635 [Haemaphysalis longicornis]|uniref:SKI/SNO/DAC domain-containing protein n=1 Tax=Haemaphysalis longicornis TaxID=44386 RepID=A0A9J6GGR9_HAELO|nr:hypothetical protein HPB48_018635 [Haemaphysalis longicornis]